MNQVLLGAIAMASLTVGLFFLRFWRKTGDRLVFDCDHSERMAFSRYLLSECAGLDVEASVAWFRDRGWRCDCEAFFCSDSSSEGRQAWRRLMEGR